jgi:hypothetical protein
MAEPEPTPENIAAASKAMTIVCNRFVVMAADTHTRIAFGESVNGAPPTFHFAVMLDNAGADGLAELIERLHIQQSVGKPRPPGPSGR